MLSVTGPIGLPGKHAHYLIFDQLLRTVRSTLAYKKPIRAVALPPSDACPGAYTSSFLSSIEAQSWASQEHKLGTNPP